jgi:hypothetical protein
MWKNVTLHNVPIARHVKLLLCQPIIFQSVVVIMPHQHYNCPKQIHFFNSHIKPRRLSLNQGIQVLVIISICLRHQQLYNFRTEEDTNAKGATVFGDVWCLRCTHWEPHKPVDYTYSRLAVCTVSPLCAACVSNVICASVTLKRNVFIFPWMSFRGQF